MARKTARVAGKCRVLVVAWKVKTGGGQVILREYMTYLGARRDGNTYFVLVHDRRAYGSVASSAVRVIQLPRFLNTSAGFVVAHLMAIGRPSCAGSQNRCGLRVRRDTDPLQRSAALSFSMAVCGLSSQQSVAADGHRESAGEESKIVGFLPVYWWCNCRHSSDKHDETEAWRGVRGVRNVHVVPVAVSRAQNSDLSVGGFERPVGKVVKRRCVWEARASSW